VLVIWIIYIRIFIKLLNFLFIYNLSYITIRIFIIIILFDFLFNYNLSYIAIFIHLRYLLLLLIYYLSR